MRAPKSYNSLTRQNLKGCSNSCSFDLSIGKQELIGAVKNATEHAIRMASIVRKDYTILNEPRQCIELKVNYVRVHQK